MVRQHMGQIGCRRRLHPHLHRSDQRVQLPAFALADPEPNPAPPHLDTHHFRAAPWTRAHLVVGHVPSQPTQRQRLNTGTHGIPQRRLNDQSCQNRVRTPPQRPETWPRPYTSQLPPLFPLRPNTNRCRRHRISLRIRRHLACRPLNRPNHLPDGRPSTRTRQPILAGNQHRTVRLHPRRDDQRTFKYRFGQHRPQHSTRLSPLFSPLSCSEAPNATEPYPRAQPPFTSSASLTSDSASCPNTATST